MKNIDRNAYLKYALNLTQTECARREQFSEWLPQEIIDCHAHSNLEEHVTSMSERTRAHMLSTFPYFSLEESKMIQETLHPGKKIRTLRFPKTFRGIGQRAANEYLLQKSPAEDRVALFGLPEDIEYTISMLAHPRVSALKMYYSYVEPTAQTIYETFMPEILEEAQRLNKPIILHLPKMIVRSIGDIKQMLKDFPSLRVVIAHLGSTKFVVPGLKDAYSELALCKNISLDTALNPSGDVVRMALECFGSERIMYGSDEPLHLIRSVAYDHPQKGQRIITDYPYHWVDSSEFIQFGHLATNAVHAHWQALGALRIAIESLPKIEQNAVRQKMFLTNARDFFGF